MNRNFLPGFNIFLLILVGILFYLHFAMPPQAVKPATATFSGPAAPGSSRIAYFVMDSIEKNYSYLRDVKNELKEKENQLSGQLNTMKTRYMDKVNKFQQEGQTLTQERQGTIQQELMQEQKMIQSKEQSVNGELQNDSYERLQKVNKTIEAFLKDYNKDKGYTYILGYQEGTIYYKDSSYDITDEVIKGLNENYKKKQ